MKIFYITKNVFSGCAYGCGFLVNYNDIAGSFSGIVFGKYNQLVNNYFCILFKVIFKCSSGIANTFATVPGIAAPYLVSIITKNV